MSNDQDWAFPKEKFQKNLLIIQQKNLP